MVSGFHRGDVIVPLQEGTANLISTAAVEGLTPQEKLVRRALPRANVADRFTLTVGIEGSVWLML